MKKRYIPLLLVFFLILTISFLNINVHASDNSGIHVLKVNSYSDTSYPWTHYGSTPYIKTYEPDSPTEYIADACNYCPDDATIGFEDISITGLPIAHAYLEWHYYVHSGCAMTLYINNGTEFSLSTPPQQNAWKLNIFDITKYLSSESAVNSFTARIYSGGGGPPVGLYVDYVGLIVEVGYEWLDNPSFEGSQTEINTKTSPWWSYDSDAAPYFYGIGTYGIGINGITSGYHHYYGWNNGKSIYQTIDFLFSDRVKGICLYASYIANATGNIKITLFYSDGSSSYKTQTYIDSYANYQFINFSGFVTAGKVIRYVSIQVLTGDSTQFTSIDCVSLLADVPRGMNAFSWDLNPIPYSRGNNSFWAYQGINYVFMGYVRNSSGYWIGTGSFNVISGVGVQTGTITDGVFYFTISARSALVDFSETFIITVTSTSANFTVNINAWWIYSPATPTSPSSETLINSIASIVTIFLFMFVPALLLAQMAGIYGLISGLIMGSICLYIGGMIPLWAVFLLGLAIILLLLGSRGRSGGE